MLKLLQAVQPNPLYTPGGVDNFWKVGGDDNESKAAETEDFCVPRNDKKEDLSIETRKEEGMKGSEKRREGERGNNVVGWAAAAWKNETATFQLSAFNRILKECHVEQQ